MGAEHARRVAAGELGISLDRFDGSFKFTYRWPDNKSGRGEKPRFLSDERRSQRLGSGSRGYARPSIQSPLIQVPAPGDTRQAVAGRQALGKVYRFGIVPRRAGSGGGNGSRGGDR